MIRLTTDGEVINFQFDSASRETHSDFGDGVTSDLGYTIGSPIGQLSLRGPAAWSNASSPPPDALAVGATKMAAVLTLGMKEQGVS